MASPQKRMISPISPRERRYDRNAEIIEKGCQKKESEERIDSDVKDQDVLGRRTPNADKLTELEELLNRRRKKLQALMEELTNYVLLDLCGPGGAEHGR